MACSKVLLGNCPELTDDIIQYFRDDIPTLNSCILVNKFWCQIAIPLLWKDPFSMNNPKNFHFIEIYLQKINEKDKTQLNRCGINNNKAQIVLDSVKIFGQNLNYFSIYVSLSHNETNESIMEMFSRLVHVLPCKLEYLNLHFNYQIRKNVWEVFLKNLKHIFIKKLLFKINNLFDDILPYIKEYIMKEQRTEYLAIEGRIETQSKYYYSIDWDKKELLL
ncbi:hypothetical protein GLOIN_2v1783347 [Rhizophagus irregularis DAOM 181602=DAOM 197198]|uniref:F-box domain-containing protein n=1 Tax=Rhizophagus irregularis (strain DAOM 181602 / DAOM 197198 / MUCL 43194) TaxID=747089 RepID=A0A2P4PFD5_RHIID|nr:hypothetical protein GLOIN_2v1783347 [Rhizophagus irregularis DAOM 181602=DAOM 197198]POG64091.1 hypothetical protein GLOIN_2v1783347 [Rhizophagus irregularis DAOM 181602=DAOM 197198]|eukprot:XP_025170957.1 hypothetical protein GLOIN_2v1783347 [Rhizophagus irregularis DAOM 181602=DAOM 197198]